MKVSRVTVLMTLEEKATLTARSAALGMPAAELIRCAVQAYDPAHDDDALAVLAAELAIVVDNTDAKVDAALTELHLMRNRLAELDHQRVSAAAP